MHVIAKPALVEFWTKHPDAETSLQAWFRTVESRDFSDFNDLRSTFAAADHVGAARTGDDFEHLPLRRVLHL